jgi:uncharacterized protein YdhG (YjbR/CyaY superfamily)
MRKSKEVEVWFARYDNPMKDVVARIREIILAADPRISECIKWQAPTFVFEGNLASFFPKSKQHASLMFHTGAHIPGKFPRLEGGGDTSRVMKIGSLAEADAARRELEQIVRAWCNWRAPKTPPTGAKTPAKRGATPARGAKQPVKKAVKARRKSFAPHAAKSTSMKLP